MCGGNFFTNLRDTGMIIIPVPTDTHFRIGRAARRLEDLFGCLCICSNGSKDKRENENKIFYIAVHCLKIWHYKLMSMVLLPVAGLPASIVTFPLPFISHEICEAP